MAVRGSPAPRPHTSTSRSSTSRKPTRELERTGRLTEAAFVYADLLNDPRAAIDLLEHNDRIYLAAELAEGQDLEPALVIRLWWRAGGRPRAVEVARSRGAFAVGIERLHAIDPGAGPRTPEGLDRVLP